MFEFSFPVADAESAENHARRIDGLILNFLNADLGTECVKAVGPRVFVGAKTLDRLMQIIADLREEGMLE